MNSKLSLAFSHHGQIRTLTKHPAVQDRVRHGLMSEAEALATPWYLRTTFNGQRTTFRLDVRNKQAISDALDKLDGAARKPEDFKQYLAAKEAKRGVTLGTLAEEWQAAQFNRSQTKTRTPAQQQHMADTLGRALPWWRNQVWAGITPQTHETYVTDRRAHVRPGARFTGDRSADLELACLSCLAKWAILTGRVDKNPFSPRTRFQEPDEIHHCHTHMPDSDDQLHRVLAWLWTTRNEQTTIGNRHRASECDLNQDLAAGYLAFTALSGLRPGEVELLRRLPPATEFPERLASAAPGLVYPLPDGTRKMKVQRLKHGQNPAILIHPVLADFLNIWNAWLDVRFPLFPLTPETVGSAKLFPIGQELVAKQLGHATAALQMPAYKPHGFGRGYYVRVRRSAGVDDAAIAVELGQSSNGALIRSTYGDPGDGVGGNLHDWLPKGPPAWDTLRSAVPANLLNIKFG